MRSTTSHIPSGRASVAQVLGLVWLLWGAVGGERALAQSDSASSARVQPTWQLIVDGTARAWDAPAWPLDSVHAVTRRALAHVQRGGYYRARIDSVATRRAQPRPVVTIFVQQGPQIPVGVLHVEGAEAMPPAELRAMMETTVGDPLDPGQLEADIETLLAWYEEAGYPLAQIQVAETRLRGRPLPSLQVTLRVTEGPALWLKRVQVPGEVRTTSRFVRQTARLDVGAPLTTYDPGAIRQRLQDTGLFREVGPPVLRVGDDGGAIVEVPLEENAPGTFDLVMGYLPPDAQRRSGQLVGSGHLQLNHLFGGGRTAGLAIDRRPGRVSTADVRVADPYLLGMPLRLEGRFIGEQRDSTYSKQRYHLATGFMLDGRTTVFGALTRELTQPGVAGTELQGGMQQIPRASVWFTGLGVRVRRVDRAVNPRQGFWLETSLERGRKTRRFRMRTADGDTTRQRDAVRQERLQLGARAFVPTWAGQLIAAGVDGSVLRSETYDRSDLFRLGGATTLRGYDEDRFLGHAVGRLLLEYRYQIDRASFAYLFGDIGFVATPALGNAAAQRGWHPGYGLGIQVSTDLGLIRASYALNPDDPRPSDGRIHLGLSVGL